MNCLSLIYVYSQTVSDFFSECSVVFGNDRKRSNDLRTTFGLNFRAVFVSICMKIIVTVIFFTVSAKMPNALKCLYVKEPKK